nr:trna (guanine(9)-n1)-methyltransferase [Quercus suber]
MMESEERPSKIRKLSAQEQDDEAQFSGQPMIVANGAKSVESLTPVDKTVSHYRNENEEPSIKVANATNPETEVSASSENPPLSKNQQKKLRKKQEWESKREERKVIRKEKSAAKRTRKREERRKEASGLHPDSTRPQSPTVKVPLAKPVQLPITFMIDCDFDDLMRDNERISLASQITRSYSDNKNSQFRAHLAICSFGGKLRERFEQVLTHYKGWRGVKWLDESFDVAGEKAKEWMNDEQKGGTLGGVFSKYHNLDEADKARLKDEGEIVYLSSEGEKDLLELKPYSTYIIGGLVDKNREKGICHKRATMKGIRTARLPIGEFLEMASRKVLATNHVNEIMVKWLECGDWGEAFIKAIPKRKGGVLKGQAEDNEEEVDILPMPDDRPEMPEADEVANERNLTAAEFSTLKTSEITELGT